MPTTLNNPLTILGGTGVTASNSGDPWYGTIPLNHQISVGNDISITGNVQFNAVTESYWKFGDDHSIQSNGHVLGSVTYTGTTSVSSTLTISGNSTMSGNITAEKIITELTSSSTIHDSGSTQFGDSIDDDHIMVGSVYQSGSISLNEYTINEFSNDGLLADSSSISLPTEKAFKTYVDAQGLYIDRQEYVRKNFSKKADSISNNTASFSAVTASAPSEMVDNNEDDFIFFNNGQVMEHDALTIQQSRNTFYLIVDSDNIGYNLESDDEIKVWGKFNS